MERDKIILVDGSLRGATLVLCTISLIALITGPHLIVGLSALFGAIVAITLSWGIGRVFKNLDLPS